MSETNPTTPLAAELDPNTARQIVALAEAAVATALATQIAAAAATSVRSAKPGLCVPMTVLGGLVASLLCLAFPLFGRAGGWPIAVVLSAGLSGSVSAFLWARAARLPEEKDSNAAAAGFSGATVLFSVTNATVPLWFSNWWPTVFYAFGLLILLATAVDVWQNFFLKLGASSDKRDPAA